MIGTSRLVMFVLMDQDRDGPGYAFLSDTRASMAVLTGAAMAFVRLSFMLSFCGNKAVKVGIFLGSAVIFAASLWLVRGPSRCRISPSWGR